MLASSVAAIVYIRTGPRAVNPARRARIMDLLQLLLLEDQAARMGTSGTHPSRVTFRYRHRLAVRPALGLLLLLLQNKFRSNSFRFGQIRGIYLLLSVSATQSTAVRSVSWQDFRAGSQSISCLTQYSSQQRDSCKWSSGHSMTRPKDFRHLGPSLEWMASVLNVALAHMPKTRKLLFAHNAH